MWKDGFVQITTGPLADEIRQIVGNTDEKITVWRDRGNNINMDNFEYRLFNRDLYRLTFCKGEEDLWAAKLAASTGTSKTDLPIARHWRFVDADQ